MKAISFKQQNIVFGEGQEEYLPLPAHLTDDATVITCWKPSLMDRIKMLFTGKIYLSTLHCTGPLNPQLLTTSFKVE